MHSTSSPDCKWLNTRYVIQATCLLLSTFFTGNSALGLQIQTATKSINDEIAERFSQGRMNIAAAMHLLSQATSEQLLSHKPMALKPPADGKPYVHRNGDYIDGWVDGLVIDEIRKRLNHDFKTKTSTPNIPQGEKIPTIDRQRGLAVFTRAINTKPLRYQTLQTLPLMSDAEFEEIFPSIFECLSDRTKHEILSPRECHTTTISISEQAVAILQGKQAAKHEKEFIELLTDQQSYLRARGVEILSGYLPVFRRNGDRLLAMIHDDDAEVRDVLYRHLPLLTERLPEVITALTTHNTPSHWALHSLEKIFPDSTPNDQNRIAAKLVDWMILHPTSCQNWRNDAPDSLLIKVIPDLEKSALDNALDRLLTIFDQDEPADFLLELFSVSGARAKKVVPALQRSLSSTTGRTQIEVTQTIYRITGDASKVLPCYRAALESEDVNLQRAASAGARKLGAEAAELAPLLVSLLESSYDIRHVSTLKHIGPPAAKTLPRLEALYTETEDANRKKALQSAIQAIRGESLAKKNKQL